MKFTFLDFVDLYFFLKTKEEVDIVVMVGGERKEETSG